MRRFIAILSLMPALLLAAPTAAQFGGTPGNAPLTPDGPRRGLGPPSITDHVPDLRLHSDQFSIPGAGPPLDGRGSWRPAPPSGRVGLGHRFDPGEATTAPGAGRSCSTPQRICTLVSPAPVGTGCSCRLPAGKRARGFVVP